MSGIKDVAKMAGVSISTVSNVLNKSRYVSPELAKRVEDAVEALSYEVNPIARSMKNNKTGMIGVITEDICGVFYPYVVKGISSVAREKGYQVIICDAQSVYGDIGVIKREEEIFRRLVLNQVDGIIFVSAVPENMKKKYLAKILKLTNEKKKIPIVSIERDFSEEGIDSVYFDSYQNAIMAVQHLVDCGCHCICHITGPTDMQVAQERVRGYRKCMEDNGLQVEESMIASGDYSHQSGYAGTMRLLENHPELDGIFCGNDQMAVGALKALKQKGKRIPEDIKLMGYDNVFVSSIVEPSLSTIHIKKRRTGIQAAEILFQRLENPEGNQEPVAIRMESSLVVRRSTVGKGPVNEEVMEW